MNDSYLILLFRGNKKAQPFGWALKIKGKEEEQQVPSWCRNLSRVAQLTLPLPRLLPLFALHASAHAAKVVRVLR